MKAVAGTGDRGTHRGMQVYMPRGIYLKRQLRDMEVFDKFIGRNVSQLSLEYKVIAKMRALEM